MFISKGTLHRDYCICISCIFITSVFLSKVITIYESNWGHSCNVLYKFQDKVTNLGHKDLKLNVTREYYISFVFSSFMCCKKTVKMGNNFTFI